MPRGALAALLALLLLVPVRAGWAQEEDPDLDPGVVTGEAEAFGEQEHGIEDAPPEGEMPEAPAPEPNLEDDEHAAPPPDEGGEQPLEDEVPSEPASDTKKVPTDRPATGPRSPASPQAPAPAL
jgi:hypothetical protein